jgi:hypothetical protein
VLRLTLKESLQLQFYKVMTRIVFVLFILSLSSKHGIAQRVDTISIENVNVITMVSDEIMGNQRVLIAGGRIIKIESGLLPLHNSVTQKINGRNKYLIPGLSEMHYHFRSGDIQSDLKLLIANGITTARNMAETDGQDQMQIKARLQSGELFGPQYFTTGPYLRSKDLSSIQQVIDVVEVHKTKGYDFLKIADNLPKDIYLKLLSECQKNNLPVIGHAQREMPLEYSMRMKSIEHIEEFLYLADREKGLSYFKQPTGELNKIANGLRESGIYIGTTLSVFDFINKCMDDDKFAALKQDSLVKYLARNERESFLTEKNDYRKIRSNVFDGLPAKEFFAAQFNWMKNFSGLLSDNRVKLLTGSDTYGMVIVGFSLHKEFELLQESGLNPLEILRASTVNPARYLNSYGDEGTISEGKKANLVLLSKNPLTDIKNARSIEGVVLSGKWFDRGMLDKMLSEVERAYR